MNIFKFLTLILFFTLSFQVMSDCTINLNQKIYLIGKLEVLPLSTIVKNSTCSIEASKLLKELLHGQSGQIKTIHLQKVLGKELKQLISIKPKNIQIKSLRKFIKDKFNLEKIQDFSNIQLIDRKKSIVLNSGEMLGVLEETKLRPGRQSLPLSIINILNGAEKRIWIKGNLTKLTKVLVAANDLHAGKILKKDFVWKLLPTNRPDEFFQDYAHIAFNKLNKSLNKGTPLKRHDLSPQYLIQMGRTINVTMKGSNIRLKARAFSLGSAKFGDEILLRNIKSNKKFFAKAINYNEAVVEL